jgi:hypothetical protein
MYIKKLTRLNHILFQLDSNYPKEHHVLYYFLQVLQTHIFLLKVRLPMERIIQDLVQQYQQDMISMNHHKQTIVLTIDFLSKFVQSRKKKKLIKINSTTFS